ncbi:hypothetical protein QC764_305145 [Podospora pseudoanserina]|uniref:Uncharacterized protein n=1 Tax=Podospora pseudoanserina TaxID=2609844 RepID=A0ABR0ID84_9PEZI|nr:hypothetical protein QC764_305145 [Podospora pseudoanserina]
MDEILKNINMNEILKGIPGIHDQVQGQIAQADNNVEGEQEAGGLNGRDVLPWNLGIDNPLNMNDMLKDISGTPEQASGQMEAKRWKPRIQPGDKRREAEWPIWIPSLGTQILTTW